MTPIIAWQDSKIRLIFAGKERPFRPLPAKDDLLEEAAEGRFSVSSPPGVWQAFQIVAESETDCAVQSIRCTGLEAGEEFTCLGLEGVDSAGHPFTKNLRLEAGDPWPLWCLVRLLSPGRRDLTLEVTVDGETIPLTMSASACGNTDPEAGCGDRDSLARLSWLNSRRGISDGILAPFLPVFRDGAALSILGRDVILAPNGMPARILTHFTGDNSRLTENGRPILAAPLAIEVTKDGAEYLLVEVSGLPFGLTGEMLQNGGNPWRGMLYGMTGRYPWAGKDPAAIWALRDAFGFDDVRMIGFWDEELPVSAGREDVKATVYENRDGELLICFASFAGTAVRFTPTGGPFDDPARGDVFLPGVEGLQERADYPGGELEIAPSSGIILWAKRK